MRRTIRRPARRLVILGAAGICAALMMSQPGPVAAQETAARFSGCAVGGSWLGGVSTGCTFFASYSTGATANSGPMTVEWIAGDPTLFGNFPTAVTRTQGSGSWQAKGQGHEFTWTCYGLDAGGSPVYAMTVSGSGGFEGCGTVVFEWVGEVFPWPLNPLVDTPPVCISGTGTALRIAVDLATCP